MDKQKTQIITKSYTLPKDVAKWLQDEAKTQNFRSVSHFLETIIREKRNTGNAKD